MRVLKQVFLAGLVLFGALLVGRWVFQWEGVTRILVGSSGMGLVAPMLICLGGAVLLAGPAPIHSTVKSPFWWIAEPANAVVMAFASLMLLEHLTGASLGVDFFSEIAC